MTVEGERRKEMYAKFFLCCARVAALDSAKLYHQKMLTDPLIHNLNTTNTTNKTNTTNITNTTDITNTTNITDITNTTNDNNTENYRYVRTYNKNTKDDEIYARLIDVYGRYGEVETA
eukprot:CAMPEP_0174267380 /NCGR_PEP_ID=MMETSP0439-20130205/33442_1 /TAXON_ID=0 /ORGANISM="Stereomyxa ramosa, Strain Chinc5" /LENGTH=117 /DNA_ID=CAMNT_0015354841 /DNA_START=232 /DNA_END=581 /DNA_ORIENTATION=+